MSGRCGMSLLVSVLLAAGACGFGGSVGEPSGGGYGSGDSGAAAPGPTSHPGGAAGAGGSFGSGIAVGPAGESLGVTPGGAKDIGHARDVINRAGVPQGNTITVEGLLSEHDIPVEGGACTDLLCTRPALGVAPFLETESREHFVQIGFTSGFRKSTFRRPPLDIVVLIDHSSAMAVDQVETNAAVMSLIDKMRDDDRLGVMIFNDRIDTLAPLGPVSDREGLKAKVKAVKATGGFSVIPAMQAAYGAIEAVAADASRLRRVMIFSCGYPPVSLSPTDPVRTMVNRGAAQRIGLTFFGVLLGWNRELADLLGQARGGAYYYLQDLNTIEKVFDVDFDYMVTPILYDLKLSVDASENFQVVKLYGMPGTPDEPQNTPPSMMTIPPAGAGQGQTGGAFLSSRRGAIVAHLRLKAEAARGGAVGTVTLAYAPEPALGFGDQPVMEKAEIVDVGDPAQSNSELYQGKGVHLATVLLNQATRMKAACDAFHKGDRATAREILDTLIDYMVKQAEALDHQGLRDETKLVTKLRANMGG